MSMIPIEEKVYDDGRTKQSFKDSTDINRLLAKARREGSLSHLEKYGGQYGDLSDFDFMEAQLQIAKGREIFEALPGELRREFKNDPRDFFQFVNDPANVDRLPEIFPDLAKPGTQARKLNDGSGKVVLKDEAPKAPVEPPKGPPEGEV